MIDSDSNLPDADDIDDIDDIDDGALDEYRAVVAKVDITVATLSAKAGDALRCQRGCASCCVDGLAVLPVEAEAVARHLETTTIVSNTSGGCVFLDDDGACQVYEARPLLCRTHGLALRTDSNDSEGERRGLRIVDQVSVCELNYQERAPAADEVLNAASLLALLVVVNQRFCTAAGLDDPQESPSGPAAAHERIPLRALLT